MDTLVNNREDFEKLDCIKDVSWTEYQKSIMWQVYQEATARQQKIIDAQDIYIKKLEAENPDVPCPACKGKGYDEPLNYDKCATECNFCEGYSTVSTVKALQYWNEQLKSKCNNYAKRLVVEGIDDVSFLGSAIVEGKI